VFAPRLAADEQVADNDVHAGGVGYRDHETPNPVLARDARTLIGMLAYLEGALLDGSVTEDWAQKLRARFIREGLLPSESTDRDVRRVMVLRLSLVYSQD
jgi:hypothetical protein